MFKKAIILALIVSAIYACATVPVTGRRQLSLITNGEIIPMASTQYLEVLKKGPISTNQEQTALVKNVGVKIQKAGDQPIR